MAKKADKPLSFEEGLDELQQIVDQLESGDILLEKSLELFESGVKKSEALRQQLQQAEDRVEILLKREGKVEAAPFDLDDGEPES